GTKISHSAAAARPTTAARHSIKLVEEPPSNATGANASRSAINIAVPTILPPLRSGGAVATVSRRHNNAMPPSHRPKAVPITRYLVWQNAESRSSQRLAAARSPRAVGDKLQSAAVNQVPIHLASLPR